MARYWYLARQNLEVALGLAAIMNNLALVYAAFGRYASAEPLCNAARTDLSATMLDAVWLLRELLSRVKGNR